MKTDKVCLFCGGYLIKRNLRYADAPSVFFECVNKRCGVRTPTRVATEGAEKAIKIHASVCHNCIEKLPKQAIECGSVYCEKCENKLGVGDFR